MRASLVVQWLRLRLPLQGVQVQSLVRELRSHMPCENENINQNQYCNKFNKDFKEKKKKESKKKKKIRIKMYRPTKHFSSALLKSLLNILH